MSLSALEGMWLAVLIGFCDWIDGDDGHADVDCAVNDDFQHETTSGAESSYYAEGVALSRHLVDLLLWWCCLRVVCTIDLHFQYQLVLLQIPFHYLQFVV